MKTKKPYAIKLYNEKTNETFYITGNNKTIKELSAYRFMLKDAWRCNVLREFCDKLQITIDYADVSLSDDTNYTILRIFTDRL